MDASPITASSPQAESSDASPTGTWYARNLPDMANELNSIHAQNATCAAFHADVAAKHAASLAQWVQYLWGQIAGLQTKVVELEDWKMKTLDDMNKLRFEHKLLRKKVSPDVEEDVPALPGKAKSLPLLLADHVDPGSELDKKAKKNKALASTPPSTSMRAPPGLDGMVDKMPSNEGVEKSKSVRFAAGGDMSPAVVPSESDDLQPQLGGRSISMMSEVSHVTDAVEEGLLEGVSVVPAMVDGIDAEVAQWRIGHLSTKLRGCMGRALVSSPFSMWGLQDLRLMVFPDGKEVAKGPRSRRQKELYAKKVSEGPLEGCLKLKVPDCPAPHVLKYYLKIGSCRQGPFEHDFSESTVNGCLDFGVDWLQQVDPDHSLTVTVEVLKQGAVADAKAQVRDCQVLAMPMGGFV
eukprot:CAMPEP_0115188728 /NCGR_PEP_ID=MMETSP0270-20121206/11158_1 /TAXON_ID=71861 /ORGANISM="Scrippsiella trochoidea, Strain CCMP3099" /LENGTH=406 /DNA_ID=CAMNT_0002601915 /DNA_START=30 /DNA_END=1251 /DNA_ORIENTATION=+